MVTFMFLIHFIIAVPDIVQILLLDALTVVIDIDTQMIFIFLRSQYDLLFFFVVVVEGIVDEVI